jgi:hypothetical protein
MEYAWQDQVQLNTRLVILNRFAGNSAARLRSRALRSQTVVAEMKPRRSIVSGKFIFTYLIFVSSSHK